MAKKKSAQPAKAKAKHTAPPKPAAVPSPSPPPAKSSPGIPIVGIGASAGGLDAFKRFFIAMPADSGIGFVLIPHLDPKHESLMVELLSRHTKMPVHEAADGTAVQPNHVYIIPPNKYMTIFGGILRLTGPVERGSWQTSIDLFLRSLADDQSERAICIILSGTGGHGTLGLKAVKAAGGMAMVQDPATAEYPRMPQNAIATGQADYVLPVEAMPKALVRYVQHSYVNGGAHAGEPEGPPDELNQVLALLRTRTKFDFRCYRKKMLMRRIERRMGLSHFERLADYIAHLREHPEEVKQLSRDLLISVTSFFRDPEALETLPRDVVAPLIEAKNSDALVRVWVPGCATGEEAYTLAILILEECGQSHKVCHLQVFATDVDEDALETARQGRYPETIAADLSPERLARFFVKLDDNSYRVNQQVRESVVFAAQNLIADAPFSKVDIVSCRNILIYLEPEVQKKVIALLHFALVEGGFLLLGPSETIGRNVDLFAPVSKKWRIFRRIGPTRSERVEFPIGTGPEHGHAPQRRIVEPTLQRPLSYADLAQRLLMETVAPAAVLINRKYEALYFLGPITRFLDVPAGEPTQDVMMMAREGLRTKLRGAVHRAIEENHAVELNDVQVRRTDNYQRISVTVKPVLTPKNAEGLLLVVFQDVVEPELGTHATGGGAEESALVRQLEYELRATKEDLQSNIEEMESANEELKASNEEVMSMNEELQSANEELETSKEELQSLNEELSTVNNQLQEKVEQLEDTNNDMANFLNCTDIATVFLDPELRIRRYTPAATRMMNVVATDVGRPLTDIKLKFHDDALASDAKTVMTQLTQREVEVPLDDGRWCIRRVIPYRTFDNHIEGVVVTFSDVTELKIAGIKSSLFATVMRNTRDAVIVHDFDGQITSWNRGAELLYGYSEAEALTMNVRQLVPDAHWPDYQNLLNRIRHGDRGDSWDTQRLCKDGRLINVGLTATALTDETGRPMAVAKINRDVTVQALAKLESEVARRTAELQEKEARLQAILDAPDDAIITIDRSGAIESVNPATDRVFGHAAHDVIGRNINVLIPPPKGDSQSSYVMRLLEAGDSSLTSGGCEIQARRRNGDRFWVDLAMSQVKDRNLFTCIIRDITRRKELEREIVEIVALEQQRIGQDLHDDCGQIMTALGLLAGNLANLVGAVPEAAALLAKIRRGIGDVLSRLRNIAQGLAVTDIKAAALPDALRDLALRLGEASVVRCVYEGNAALSVGDDARATHLYHIAQEACNNAVKHSKAQRVVISLRADDRAIVLEVRDDGVGITAEPSNGLGLRIMHNRAAVIGAKLSIQRAEPKGTRVTCTLTKDRRHAKC